ncbi:F0F1 ATP synthase subunit A [Candidatus Gracilibacteria bacterium]|nr:MAG: F0F1 ATP synthase subunit A [Candidatus Gracilibacteria bacterium]
MDNSLFTDILKFYSSSVFYGELVVILFFILVILGFKYFRNSGFVLFFEFIFETVYEFFEDILGKEEDRWIKVYVTSVFFIILTSNFLGVIVEIISPIGGSKIREFTHFFEHNILQVPTTDINFNIAMALVGVFLVIFVQFKSLGIPKGIYEYFPIFGKNYVPYEFGKKSKWIDIPLFLVVKILDIIISVFLGLLEIVGHIAKIISLAFRLFGNMTSGGLLLAMLVVGLAGLTSNLIGIDFPIIGPIVIHFQGMLVALIQALVFPLLIAIFMKVAKSH